eukprot:TRINITY_DN9600_c0_g1_i1.p1 TRINITY_DN9600_c0_g1~~TRINITY_DN9600_c0_g1_i1.p1  ORF type:complete len:276 (-),score=67.42 TRINITY_DN9600_c0_g1_i1:1-828(-)
MKIEGNNVFIVGTGSIGEGIAYEISSYGPKIVVMIGDNETEGMRIINELKNRYIYTRYFYKNIDDTNENEVKDYLEEIHKIYGAFRILINADVIPLELENNVMDDMGEALDYKSWKKHLSHTVDSTTSLSHSLIPYVIDNLLNTQQNDSSNEELEYEKAVVIFAETVCAFDSTSYTDQSGISSYCLPLTKDNNVKNGFRIVILSPGTREHPMFDYLALGSMRKIFHFQKAFCYFTYPDLFSKIIVKVISKTIIPHPHYYLHNNKGYYNIVTKSKL